MTQQYSPSREQFLELSRTCNLIPVHAEFYGDMETPVGAYAKLRGNGPSFLLESVVGGESVGRYSFLGSDPCLELRVFDDRIELREKGLAPKCFESSGDPMAFLESYFSGIRMAPAAPGAPAFTGGAVGYVGYESIHRFEPSVPRPSVAALPTPLAYFLITGTVVVFDHARQKLSVYANARLDESTDVNAAYDDAINAIEQTLCRLSTKLQSAFQPIPSARQGSKLDIRSNFTAPQFCEAVAKVKAYIRDGDVFQTVLSQRFEVDYPRDALHLYRSLRCVNPSPYMTLLECEDLAVVSASPEVHVKVTHGKVEIRPIAGTRPRGNDPEEDLALERDLLADAKEKAEHLMLVDLARNDIGRVCKVGSVSVPRFMLIERYSHVMHIVSQVFGDLAEGKNAFDLMRATFPAGTISGAPKVRAMQVIAELERCQRGVYSGALGYFSFNGNHDSAIAIRTAVLSKGKVYVQAGAGIVADSDPMKEYEETVNKAKAMLRAVEQSLLVE
jgi:anthranilate synthase component 1